MHNFPHNPALLGHIDILKQNQNSNSMSLRGLLIVVVLFFGVNAKAQCYPFDTIAVKYEVVSIDKARKAYVSALNKTIRKLKKDSKANSVAISKYKDYKKEFRQSKDTKDGYVLTLKNVETGGYYDVVTVKSRNIKGEKIRKGNIYEIRLEKCFKEDIVPRIGMVFKVTVDDVTIRVVSHSWTANVYVTPDLRGLFVLPPPVNNISSQNLSTSAFKAQDICLESLTDIPKEIDGCSCAFSVSQEKLAKGEYVFVNDFASLAFVKVDGELKRFELQSHDEASNTYHYLYGENTMEVRITNRITCEDGSELMEGTITIRMKKGTIKQKFVGRCDC